MYYEERETILKALDLVRWVIPQIDTDFSVCKTISNIVNRKTHINNYHTPYDCFLFGNGGDRAKLNTPEVDTCIELGVGLVWGLGNKIQSSSVLTENWKKE